MAFYTLLTWLPLLLIPLLLLLLKNQMGVRKQNKQLPPSPPKLPIVGNLHQLGALAHQSLWQLSKRYGPVMLLQLGRIPLVIISSAEAAREVLKTYDLHCCSRPTLAGSGKLSYNYLDIAFAPYGEVWREIRKICVLEVFSLKRVQSFLFIREEEVDLFMNSISQSATSAAPIDLSEKLFALTASIVFRMSFGRTFLGSDFDNYERFSELVHESEAVVGSLSGQECIPYVGWIIDRLNGHHAKIERVFQELDTFFQQVIDDHVNNMGSKQGREDVIDVLLRLESTQTELGAAWLTKNHMKAVLLNLFLGGIDTSAITVTWAMAELARNPRVMKKAQDEVRNHAGNKGRVTEDDINRLQYLKMVIKETLRLHPPAPLLLSRETMSHFKINSLDIYPKTLIQVNAWAIGRDPKYWKKPEEFFPERFMDSSIDFRGQHFEYLPFGAGRRICPGMHMGTVTVEVILANLLYCFNWKLPSGMNEEDINMDEAAGLSLTVHKRTALNLVPVNYLQKPSGDHDMS